MIKLCIFMSYTSTCRFYQGASSSLQDMRDGTFGSPDWMLSMLIAPVESAVTRLSEIKRVTADSTGAINIDNIQSGPPEVPSRMSWSELEAP